jgi:hypothetical protein
LSIKYATGLADCGFGLLRLFADITTETNRTAMQTCDANGELRHLKGFVEIMSHRHGRLRPQLGQAARGA